MRAWPLLLLLAGCEGPDPDPFEPPVRCGAPEPAFEVEAAAGSLEVGIPPQGGAPYTPFLGRVQGFDPEDRGFFFEMTAVDAESGELLGDTDVAMQWICANVGEDAGWYVGAELHLRYDGWLVEELRGRTAEIVFTARTDDGAFAEDVLMGPLIAD